uniref:Secreted protein n=1 Tax=Meleagris gallopavo TaxID=9103 RepID=A0A803Y142_MELGA
MLWAWGLSLALSRSPAAQELGWYFLCCPTRGSAAPKALLWLVICSDTSPDRSLQLCKCHQFGKCGCFIRSHEILAGFQSCSKPFKISTSIHSWDAVLSSAVPWTHSALSIP